MIECLHDAGPVAPPVVPYAYKAVAEDEACSANGGHKRGDEARDVAGGIRFLEDKRTDKIPCRCAGVRGS